MFLYIFDHHLMIPYWLLHNLLLGTHEWSIHYHSNNDMKER
uniref:Uncharacterized protein n=1 Tax=Lepeophtheirus salmonis TaxID=72036 RepID=A0A0K2UGR2_LEPSM